MGTNASKVIRYNKAYAVLIARAVDIIISTFIWRDYDITISAQCGLACRRPFAPAWARALNWFLNAIETGHCELAITCDIERAQEAIRILTESPTTAAALEARAAITKAQGI